MKNFKNAKIIVSVLCVLALCIPTLAADPGSSDDPLVTLSYVNDVLVPQIKGYIDSSLENFASSKAPSDSLSQGSYEIVNLNAGQTLIGGQSCHIILRMGSATVLSSQKGGIADVTNGVDLFNGSVVPANHLLIIPVDDGRGITMQTDGIIMVSGKFSVL